MGNSANKDLALIERKYGNPAIDYIIGRHNERLAYTQTRDELQRIIDHANLQEREDIEWINQEKRLLDQTLEDAKNEAEAQRKGLVQENEAKHKKSVRQFSGYNDQVKRLDELEKRVKDQYNVQRNKIKSKIDQEIRRLSNKSSLTELPEFDSKSDGQRKDLENECLRKYPSKESRVNTVEIERTLKWENFKPDFEAILDRSQVGKQNSEGRDRLRSNIAPAKAPVCC